MWTVVFDKSNRREPLTEYGAYIIEGDEVDACLKFKELTGLEVSGDLMAIEFSYLEEAEFAACTDRVLYVSR